MSAQNDPWKNDSGPSSTAPHYKFLLRELEKGKEELEEKNKEIKELKERLHCLEQELSRVNVRIDSLVKENEELRKKRDSPSLTPAGAYLYLGAMCDRLQTKMYQQVFPLQAGKRYPEFVMLKVNDIERKLSKGETSARERWNALQKKLKWDPERHLVAIKNCKRSRNEYSHPNAQLTEPLLTKSVELLEREGHFYEDWLSLEVVQELITMWKMLEE